MKKLKWILALIFFTLLFHLLTIKIYPYYEMLKLKMSRASKMNDIFHEQRITDRSRKVVRPSPNLIYSACGFDLSESPLRIKAIIPDDTYWSVSMFALNTDN